MKARLAQWMQRYDALSVRERVLVAVALLAVVAFLGHALVVAPTQQRRAGLLARMAQQTGELESMRAQIAQIESSADPDAANRARLAQARAEMVALDARLARLADTLVTPARMPELLRALLARQSGLRLVSLQTLEPAEIAAAAAAPDAATAAPEAPSAGLYRHGVELVVEGGYAELLDYLATLERLPQRLYWERASLRVAQYPVSRLTLRLFTLSTERTWLQV